MDIKRLLAPFELFKKLLKIIGLYRDGTQTRTRAAFGYAVYVFLEVYLVTGQIIHFIIVDNWQERMVNMALAATVVGVNFKVQMYLKYVDSFNALEKRLIEIFQASCDDRVGEILDKKLNLNMKILKLYSIILIVNALIGVFVVVAFQILPYKAYYPFDTDANSIGVYIAGLHENFACFYGSVVIYFFDAYPVMIIIYVTGIVEGLSLRLKYIGTKEHLGREELVKCIKIHQTFKKFVVDIEENFKIAFLFQCTVSSLIIGLSAFSMTYLTTPSLLITTAIYCMPMMFEIFLPCYYAHELMLASENLMITVTHSKWIETDKATKKILIIFLENLKRPLQITFHGLMDINLVTFTNIMQSAYSLYAVLKRVNN